MEEVKKKQKGGKMPREESELLSRFAAYLAAQTEDDCFPNLAGFCRYCSRGEEWFCEQKEKFPNACDFIFTALEDEALNADCAPSVVTAYLKHRLGYGETAETRDGMPEVVFVDRSLAADGE